MGRGNIEAGQWCAFVPGAQLDKRSWPPSAMETVVVVVVLLLYFYFHLQWLHARASSTQADGPEALVRSFVRLAGQSRVQPALWARAAQRSAALLPSVRAQVTQTEARFFLACSQCSRLVARLAPQMTHSGRARETPGVQDVNCSGWPDCFSAFRLN